MCMITRDVHLCNFISVVILQTKEYFIIILCYLIIVVIMNSIISARKGCI